MARLAYDQKCQDDAEPKTIFNDAIKTVTMRAESLATTEAGFCKTLLDRQEEPQALERALCPAMPGSICTVRNASRKNTSTCTRLSAHEARNTFKTSARLGRLIHGSSRDIRD